MKKLYLLLGILPLVFIDCEKPPPEAWVWNVDDSLAVMELLKPEEGFLSSKTHLPSAPVEVVIQSALLDSVRLDTSSKRYLVSEFSFLLSDSAYRYEFDCGIDTTVTGYVHDTLIGTVELKVDSVLEQGSDSALAFDSTVSKMFRYSSRGAVFFDSLGGDAKWRLAKFSGGSDGQTPDVASSPSLDSVLLSYGSKNLTVILFADTSLYGLRGLFEPSELIHINAAEGVTLKGVYPQAGDTLLLYVKGEVGWVPYEEGLSLTFSKKGKTRLYIIGINLGSLFYALNEWSSVIWGIPVVVE